MAFASLMFGYGLSHDECVKYLVRLIREQFENLGQMISWERNILQKVRLYRLNVNLYSELNISSLELHFETLKLSKWITLYIYLSFHNHRSRNICCRRRDLGVVSRVQPFPLIANYMGYLVNTNTTPPMMEQIYLLDRDL